MSVRTAARIPGRTAGAGVARKSAKEAARTTLVLVLHAHLPYVRHLEHARFLEEEWLFEAIAESYLPLTALCQRLADERAPVSLTLSISPTLAAMLGDPTLQQRFVAYLDERIELAGRELFRTVWMPEWHALARWHEETFLATRSFYVDRLRGDLLGAWRDLASAGIIEPITSNATHAFLPYLVGPESLRRVQVEVAVAEHRRLFGSSPRGMWLAECGYVPGIDRLLRENDIGYTVVEAHGLEHATPRPPRGMNAPILTPEGLLVLARDPAASREIWSRGEGFPGHAEYRDFHHDAGWDLELSYLEPYLHAGRRSPLGLKYHRVTGEAREKELYRPAQGAAQARAHAREFLRRRACDTSPRFLTAPFDAELFGHWWHEGPVFLETLLRESTHSDAVSVSAAGTALAETRRAACAQPSFSSWGEGGYGATWCAPENDWMLARVASVGLRVVAAATRMARTSSAERRSSSERALAQAGRELLLAQASDWPFLVKAGTAADYARASIETHLAACGSLCDQLDAGAIDPVALAALEESRPIFPTLDGLSFADPTLAG